MNNFIINGINIQYNIALFFDIHVYTFCTNKLKIKVRSYNQLKFQKDMLKKNYILYQFKHFKKERV